MTLPASAPSLLGPAAGARRLRAALLGLLGAASLLLHAPRLGCGDLCSYLAAGRAARSDTPAAAYDAAALATAHRELHPEGGRVGGFFYSPLLLAPATWLAALPREAAVEASRLVAVLLLGFGLACVLVRLPAPGLQLAVAAAFAASHAARVQLVFLNWSFVMFAGVALAAARLRAAGPAAGTGFALALHLKPWVALLVAPLAATRLWRGVAWAAALGAVLAILSLPWVGLTAWTDWAEGMVRFTERGVTPFYNKVSLAAGFARFVTPPPAWISPREPVAAELVRAVLVAGLAALVWASWRLRAQPERLLACGLAVALLAVPQVWDHTAILLFVALPALPRRWILGLALALTATAFYADSAAAALRGALSGDLPWLAARLLLMLYPLLFATVAAGALWGRAEEPDA